MTFTEALSAVFPVVMGFIGGWGVTSIYYVIREGRLKQRHIEAIEDLRKEFMEINRL